MTILFRSLLSVRVFRDTFWGIRQHEQKNRAICRDANDYLWLDSLRTDKFDEKRGKHDFGEYRNAKCFSKEIKDRQRYNFGEFNSRSHERYVKKNVRARCLRYWNSPKSYWSQYPEGKKKKKRKRKNINTRQTLNILLIVDHNFTTIFRQPDGSAG